MVNLPVNHRFTFFKKTGKPLVNHGLLNKNEAFDDISPYILVFGGDLLFS